MEGNPKRGREALGDCSDARSRDATSRRGGLVVSVVIPCRNGERFLAEAIASARAQSRAPSEIIVVDDGSSDASRAIARTAGAICIPIPVSLGVSAARNRGIAAATGDVIAFLDADDTWEFDHLERTMAALERHPSADVAFGLVRLTGGADSDVRFSRDVLAIVDRLADKPVDLEEWLFLENPLAQSATVVRRPALLDVGGYDESLRFAEDYDLWLRLAVRRRFVCCPAFTCTYRVHPGQVSAGCDAAPRFIEAQWRARLRHLESIRQFGDPARLARLCERAQESWSHDVAQMSWTAEWDMVDQLLVALRDLPPSPWRNEALRRWRRRRRFAPLWTFVRAVWGSLPMVAQHQVRRAWRTASGSGSGSGFRSARERPRPFARDGELSSP